MSLLTSSVCAQEKYWIAFKDKDTHSYQYEKNLSKETINNRIRYGLPLYQYTDIPVKSSYKDSLVSLGVKVVCTSKWFNSVSAFLSPDQVQNVLSLPFVEGVYLIDRRIQVTGNYLDVNPNDFWIAVKQMEGDAFIRNGITGKGVSVGVIDAGFYKAFEDKRLSHLFTESRIIKERDFLSSHAESLTHDTIKDNDHHGRDVLTMITGYDSAFNKQLGMAINGNFYLARTENEANEYRGEEDNWIMAMEWMDSLGVRLINTSLGYSINMDDPKDNYKLEEMNGKTTRISQAAQMAVDEKGIFLVVSAGNEGTNSNWRIVSAPADAEGSLSVGATKDPVWEKTNYSSIGQEFVSYLKPNVSCYSLAGTSFSAPAVTGFVACLMQKDSTLSNKQLKEIIEKSSHLYPYGNNYLGYGVPNAKKALKLIEDKNYVLPKPEEKKVKGKSVLLRFDKDTEKEVVVFHKKNKTIVIQQQVVNLKDGRLKIRKVAGTTRTTLFIYPAVIEIIWE
ncbi:MAG: S8 family serine peptidase [Cytophagaceae bacterium]|nr:S8 family serine peptidase [Cytophagaceae bacterium]